MVLDPKKIEDRLREIKQLKVEKLTQLKNYQDTHAIEYFRPHPAQEPLFDAIQDKALKTFVVLGGNRSGKTEAGTAIVTSFTEHRFPWVPQHPDFDKYKPGELVRLEVKDGKAKKTFREDLDPARMRFEGPLRIRVLGEDYEKAVGQTLIPKFKKYLKPELIAGTRKHQSGVISQFVLADGTVIDFLTYQQDAAGMEGWSGHVVWYDEPPPRPIYIANQRGLVDYDGVAIFTMTPLKEPWIANEIVNVADPKTFVLTINTRQNPHLKADAIDAFEEKLSEEERETRIGGRFLHLQGLVFKEFNRQTHVIKPFEIPKNYTVYVGIDTHPRTAQALVFVAVSPRDEVFVVHDVFQHGTPEDVADWIIDFHENIHKVHAAIIEPLSRGDQNRGDTTFQIIERKLASEHIQLELGSKDLAGGILQVRQVLVTPNGRPAFWVFDTAVNTIKNFQNYVWKDWAKAAERNEAQAPLDKDNHHIECVRRLVQHPVRFVDPGYSKTLLAHSGYVPQDTEAGY